MFNEMLNLDFTKDMKSRWKMYDVLLAKKACRVGR